MMFPASCSSSRRYSLRRRSDPHHPAQHMNSRQPRIHMAVIFLLISCWVSLSAATSVANPPRPAETSLLIDTRIPVFVNGRWQIMSEEDHRKLLARRDDGDSSDSDATAITTTIEIDVSTTTAESASATVASSPLPSPFDGALSSNFSGDDGGCVDFINDMLSNSTFKQCYAFSLLLQGSQSFFQAQKQLVTITQTIEASCAADVDMCTSYFSDLSSQLISSKNCAEDYEKQNQLVVNAYVGMRAYQPVYRAACLTNPETSAYCFANAVTNLTTPSNVYLYHLPLNDTLPSTAVPSCNTCTSQTMAIYQAATSSRKSYIANTYESAAEQINQVCGSDFVNATLAEASTDSSAPSLHQAPPSLLLLLSLLFVAVSRCLF
ncbi:hypothetical protein F4778DRAFT_139703 [Xylariomycetidae sp. FL2044]|nr:hypothetical protein F4778DRAFT_139703 [Xylariomycetidae sp. FL2044]